MPETSPDSDPVIDHGAIWLDPQDPQILRMSGEIDLAVSHEARSSLTGEQAAGVNIVDLSAVTFTDSAVVSVIANLIAGRDSTREPLILRGVTEISAMVLDVSGITTVAKIED